MNDPVRRIRSYAEVASPGEENIVAQVVAQQDRLAARLAGIRWILIVASGKGGVGKSAITANLAGLLASRGKRVGVADADLNGPSLAQMMGVPDATVEIGPNGVIPAATPGGASLISMAMLLANPSAALHWRSPAAPDQSHGHAFLFQSMYEGSVLREFLADVCWGELDWLVIDAPPGTDKLERLLELLPGRASLLLVTTPSEMARGVVMRSLGLARERQIEPVGMVVNMAAHACEQCGHVTELFGPEHGVQLEASLFDLPVLAQVPFDPRLAVATDRGRCFALEHPASPAGAALQRLADRVEQFASGKA